MHCSKISGRTEKEAFQPLTTALTDRALNALAIGIIASAAFTLSRALLSSRTVQYLVVIGGTTGLAWHLGLLGPQRSSQGIEAMDEIADEVIDSEDRGSTLVENAILQEYGQYHGLLDTTPIKIFRPPPPKELSVVKRTAHDAYHLAGALAAGTPRQVTVLGDLFRLHKGESKAERMVRLAYRTGVTTAGEWVAMAVQGSFGGTAVSLVATFLATDPHVEKRVMNSRVGRIVNHHVATSFNWIYNTVDEKIVSPWSFHTNMWLWKNFSHLIAAASEKPEKKPVDESFFGCWVQPAAEDLATQALRLQVKLTREGIHWSTMFCLKTTAKVGVMSIFTRLLAPAAAAHPGFAIVSMALPLVDPGRRYKADTSELVVRAAGIGLIGLLWAASDNGESEDIPKVMLAVGVALLGITAARKIWNIFTRRDFNKKVRTRQKERLQLGGKPERRVGSKDARSTTKNDRSLQNSPTNRQGRNGTGLLSLRLDLPEKSSAEKNPERLS